MAKEVIPALSRLGEQGDVEAQFLLGSAYQEGLGVELNCELAAKWYSNPAKQKHATAMNNLAIMLALGHGIEPDIEKARQMFYEANGMGSRFAAESIKQFSDDLRDTSQDAERLYILRNMPLAQALGMQKDAGMEFLKQNGMISEPLRYQQGPSKGTVTYQYYPADGIAIGTDCNGRIVNLDAHAKGSSDFEQFMGKLPFDLTWDDTATQARRKLGQPQGAGAVAADEAYGMAYHMGNTNLVVLFFWGTKADADAQQPSQKHALKIVRIKERWAAAYPPVGASQP